MGILVNPLRRYNQWYGITRTSNEIWQWSSRDSRVWRIDAPSIAVLHNNIPGTQFSRRLLGTRANILLDFTLWEMLKVTDCTVLNQPWIDSKRYRSLSFYLFDSNVVHTQRQCRDCDLKIVVDDLVVSFGFAWHCNLSPDSHSPTQHVIRARTELLEVRWK